MKQRQGRGESTQVAQSNTVGGSSDLSATRAAAPEGLRGRCQWRDGLSEPQMKGLSFGEDWA